MGFIWVGEGGLYTFLQNFILITYIYEWLQNLLYFSKHYESILIATKYCTS
jgi:hypothetical protein